MYQVKFKFIEDQYVRIVAGPHKGVKGQIDAIIQADGERSYEVSYFNAKARKTVRVHEDSLELVAETVDLTAIAETN